MQDLEPWGHGAVHLRVALKLLWALQRRRRRTALVSLKHLGVPVLNRDVLFFDQVSVALPIRRQPSPILGPHQVAKLVTSESLHRHGFWWRPGSA